MMTTPVQLGWIQSAINYVFDKVINPIFTWASELLSDVFKWLFNTILGPLLESAFSLIMQTVGKYIMRAVGRVFYHIEEGFLLILDMFQEIFDVLAGVKQVTDTESHATGSLLSVLVRTPFVTKTMLVVISISIVLCFLFAIVGTIKSIGDMGGPQSRPVGQVLRKLALAMLKMLTAPVMGLFMVILGDAILLAITNAMTLDQNVTIARSLFVISTLDAVDDEFGAVDKYGVEHKGGQRLELSFSNQYVSASTQIGDWDNPILAYNYSTRPTYLSKHPGEGADYGLRDLYREPFYTGAKDYTSSKDVDATFNVGRIDYFTGIGGAILFIFILGTAMFTFVSRLFDVLILLIIEPFFIAPMPLDDGEHFQKWEEMFLGKLFSGYGMVVAMYVYLLVCTMVFDGRLAFTARSDMGDIMMDMLMRMLVLIGGAATVMTAGPLVTSILSSVAGEQEAASSAAGMAFTGGLMGAATLPAREAAGYALDQAADGIANGIINKMTNGKGIDQLFSGKKEDEKGSMFTGAGSNPIDPGIATPQTSPIGSLDTPTAFGPSDAFRPGSSGTTSPNSSRASSYSAAPLNTGGGGNDDDDGFETVFDVGGKSIFDDDGGAGSGTGGSAGGGQSFGGGGRTTTGTAGGYDALFGGGSGGTGLDDFDGFAGGSINDEGDDDDPFHGILSDK